MDVDQAVAPPFVNPAPDKPASTSKGKARAPSNPSNRQWDQVIFAFLQNAGLTECSKAFEVDMLVMSPNFERERVPAAIGQLLKDLTALDQGHSGSDRDLEERKLDYLPTTREAVSRTSYNRTISQFLAQSRARNDASNRSEFLRRTLASRPPPRPPSWSDVDMDNPDSEPEAGPSTCARTDAKQIDRDMQMPFDIVKNVEGPLRRTTGKGKEREARDSPGQGTGGVLPTARNSSVEAVPTMERHPGLEERFRNLEEHFAIRYVPGPPEDLLLRIKALEDHIIRLEKEYPPWAALHFNQPRRGWPPPPRTTPIIVPSHLTALHPQPVASNAIPTDEPPGASAAQRPPKKRGGPPKAESSLQRAVLEQLEVQNALKELKGKGKGAER